VEDVAASFKQFKLEKWIVKEGEGMDRAGGAVGLMERRGETYTTICFRLRSWLRMNLRVRRVTGVSRSAMVAMVRMARPPDLLRFFLSR
jgi:hypothetical protein